jgi:hypothetical protein
MSIHFCLMRFRTLIRFFFLLVSSVIFSQETDSLFFALEVSDESISEGECMVLSASIYTSVSSGTVAFKDLPSQITQISKKLWETNFFTGDTQIDRILSEKVFVGGEEYERYKLLEFGICPISSVTIPSLALTMLGLKDSSDLVLKSQPVEIKVDEKLLKSNGNPFNQIPVGHLSLTEKIDTTELKNTGSFIYELSFSGSANTFFIDPIFKTLNKFTHSTLSESYQDTIINNVFISGKTIKYLINPLSVGEINFKDHFSFTYFSKSTNSLELLESYQRISIKNLPEDTFSLNATPEANFVILLDISESMRVEDFLPSRLHFARQLVNEINKNECAKVFLYAGNVIDANACVLNDNDILNTKRGTSIGNALWSALNFLEGSENGKILVIGDGDTTAGNISEDLVSDWMKNLDYTIHTIGIGTYGRVPFGTDFFGNKRYISNIYNETSLKNLAAKCNGSFFQAKPSDSVESIAKEILSRLND